MSTSDAAELEHGAAGGGETPPPLLRTLPERRTAAREQQNEVLGERSQQEKYHGGETPTRQPRHPSSRRQEETHRAQILRPYQLTQEETGACCGDSTVQSQKSFGPRFSSSLFYRFSRNLGLENPELRLKKNLDPCLHSLPEKQTSESEKIKCQGNGLILLPDTSGKANSDSASSERIPAKRGEEVIRVVDELETTRDLTVAHTFSNGKLIQKECGDLCTNPCGSESQNGSRLLYLEEDKLEKQTDFVELSNLNSPIRTMLSSSVVTVLAPHWTGRQRRNKVNLQNVAANDLYIQRTSDGSRVPFMGTRTNKLDWSAKSGPASFDYESKRNRIQTVSLDGNSGRTDSRKRDAEASPMPSSLFLDPNERRRNSQSDHEALSPSSSKPTTSSLLLSLRRLNSNSRNPITASKIPEKNTSPLNSLSSDREGQLFAAHIPQSFHNNNTHEISKPVRSPTTIYCGTTETAPSLSPSSPIHKHSAMFETNFYSAPLTKKITEDAPFIHQPQLTNRAQTSLSCSKQTFLSREPPDKRTNSLSESSDSSARHSSYDKSPLLKTKSFPRTNLTSSSWWKQVTQEGSSSLMPSDTTNIRGKLYTPCNNNDQSDLASSSLINNNNRLSSQFSINRDNNSTTRSVFHGNMNLVMKTEGGIEDSRDHKLDRLVKQRHDSIFNIGQPQKPQSLPDVLSRSKISRCLTKHESSSTSSPHNKGPPILTKPSLSPVNTKTISSFLSDSAAPQTNIHAYTGSSYQTPPLTNRTNPTPIGFQRSYTSIPKPFHPKIVSTDNVLSKSNYSPRFTDYNISSSSTNIHPAATTAPSPSFPLTPPATPIITSPTYSDTISSKESTFSSSQERDPKKIHPHVEEKRARRVTWRDSVDLQSAEPMTDQMSSVTPSRSPQSIKSPSIFSFLRSSNPPKNTPHLGSLSPNQWRIQTGIGGKYRSLSTDSAYLASRDQERPQKIEPMISEQGRLDLITPRQERTLSLSPDPPSGYKVQYSAPPYSMLMSTRSTDGESKTMTPRSPLFQQPSQSIYNSKLSTHNDPTEVRPSQTSKLPCSPIILPQPLGLAFKTKAATQDNFETDKLNNNHGKNESQNHQNGQLLLVNNRVHISAQSLPCDKADRSSSTFVTETLVYSIKSSSDTTPMYTTSKKHRENTPCSPEPTLSHQSQIQVTAGHSDHGCNDSGSTELDDESSNTRIKDSAISKSRLLSVETNDEQSSKRNRFALKKSVSTLSSSLSRSESDRASKTNNKMDQVLNRLRQTFSTKRSDDDVSFPWKWKRASQTPSVSGSSDVSNVSDITLENTKSLEKSEPEERVELKDNEQETEVRNTCAKNRYTLLPSSASGNTTVKDKSHICSEKRPNDQERQGSCPEHMSKDQIHRSNSQTSHQLDFYKDNGTDYRTTNQFLSCRDPSPGRSPNTSAAYPTQFRKSSSSPRSPFSPFSSPFSSLSPFSTVPSTDVTDDSVLYSPKPQRRRESSSPCEPAEGISLGASRRSRASTGPPSASPVQDKDCFPSSYADLKYGIEPGRSFSVSSVLSGRPSGPGRISTGSRHMSAGDLSELALTCRCTSEDLDHLPPNWDTDFEFQPSKDCQMSCFSGNSGKMRSRSLPRSLTRRLANWSSGVSGASQPENNSTSKLAHLWNPESNICHIKWDTEGPPTPPPTPPLSPVSKRISSPPSHSSPTFPFSTVAPQEVESQSSRGRMPSRSYTSSLSTFEEFSDTSSDTTTGDEYYLESDENEEKETEL